MSEGGVIVEQPRFGNLKGKVAKIIAASTLLTGFGFAAQQGYLDDRSEAPIIDTTHSLELERSPYYGKLAVNGIAFDTEGNIIKVDSLTVDPLTEKTRMQYFRIKDNPNVDGGIQAHAEANIGTSRLDTDYLKSFGIDTEGSMIATMVYGELYGKKGDPDNIFGNHHPSGGQDTGLYWKVEGKNPEGNKVTSYIPAPLAVVETPIIKVEAQ